MAIKRADMKVEDTWDLDVMYQSDDVWREEYHNAKELLKRISKLKNVLSDADHLLDFLTIKFDLARLIDKLYNYAHLKHDIETLNPTYQILKEKAIGLYSDFEEATAFFEPLLLKNDKELIEKFYKENTKLLVYNNYLNEIYRYQEHTLNDSEEKILATLSNPLTSSSKTYSALFDSDIKFPKINVNGRKLELDQSNYIKYMASNNRKVRIAAFYAMYSTIKSHQYTIASTMSGHIEAMNKLAKVRNFDSSLEYSLFDDEIGVDLYNNLIKTVNANLNSLQEYYRFKEKLLGVDRLHIYDVYANVIKCTKTKYNYSRAKEIVLDALKPLGNDYQKILLKAFNERWIDVYHNADKTSGAYSSGCYDSYPYILLNYEGEINDVSTLAHELGHSVHTYLSNKNNTYQDASYHIFVAEIASTVNELLLSRYMLMNAKSNEEKLTILDGMLDLFKGTLFRQTMFAEFEKTVYDYSKDEVITAEYLTETYLNLNKKYFGDSLIVDEEIKYEWARVEHFYYNFYVYKYATGISIASYIVNKLLTDNTYLDKYLKFLSLGDSMPVLEELKTIDIDATRSDVIESAIDLFNATLENFKEIYKEVGEKHEKGLL